MVVSYSWKPHSLPGQVPPSLCPGGDVCVPTPLPSSPAHKGGPTALERAHPAEKLCEFSLG